jgi:pimeloyl-ACP methyl ester carboxylesterase
VPPASPHTTLAAVDDHRAIAIDLPGIGGSTEAAGSGSKAELAAVVHDLVGQLGLASLTLVGHDVGAMVTLAYLRAYDDVARAVMMNTVLPGLRPWDDVIRNPYIWHFAFHSIPSLPESLVQGHQSEYFDYFYEAISADASRITPTRRAEHAQAYGSDAALKAGFDWYRTLPKDAEGNAAHATPMAIPVLYLRGDDELGSIDDYAGGLQDAGIENPTTAVIERSGHYAPEEASSEVWEAIETFIAARR